MSRRLVDPHFQVIIERRKRMEDDSTALATGGRLAFLDLLLEMERNGDMNADDIQQEVTRNSSTDL